MRSGEASAARDRRIVRGLCAWFEANRRDLPWRAAVAEGARSPYLALVSEIMLQQTQVSRVVEKFGPFVERFPTVHDLAAAPLDDVLALWSGLGYYRRARSLHRCAQEIVDRFGEVPSDAASLETLTGIGRYTAGAIASIVFDEPAPIVDGNVTRVLLRIDGRDLEPGAKATADYCWDRAGELVMTASRSRAGGASAGAFNEAMMELGALVCTPRSPVCGECPVRAACVAHREGREGEIPRPKASATRRTLHMACVLVRDDRGRVLAERRPDSGLWSGIWQPPTVESDREIRKSVVARHFGLASRGLSREDHFVWETTHRRVLVTVYVSDRVPVDDADRAWLSRAQLARRALGSLQRRLLLKDDEDNA